MKSPPVHPACLLALTGLVALAGLTGCTIAVKPSPFHSAESRLDLSDPVLNQRRVLVVGEISDAKAADIIRQLWHLDAQSDQPIDLFLMTPGGDLNAAFAIERVIRLLQSPVNTCAVGMCNSMGAVLLAAGTGERRAFADSIIVIHGMEVGGNPPRTYVDLTQERYTAFWNRHARLPESWLPIPLGKLHFLTAQQALDYRLIDSILPHRDHSTPPAHSSNPSHATRPPPSQ